MTTKRKSAAPKSTEILVVEDSITQATQIKHLLESHHYKVIVAYDGEEAISKLSNHKPSLIISDIVMPEMNGYELCKKIKSNKNTEDIPVILLTRLSDTEEIMEGLSCGADSFITKPYNEKYLLSHVERILSEENGAENKKLFFDTQILFKGKKRFIQAEQQNVINLMLSIYEGAILQNEKLIQTQEELRLLNERLESLVEDRTSDLTEEIKLSNQITNSLKESEEKWRTLVTNIPDYIALHDCEGKFLYLNHYAEGLSEKDTIGKSQFDFMSNESKEIYRQNFEECLSSGKNQEFEYTAFGDNKVIRTYESSLIPLMHKGKVSNIMAIARDITERKLAEEKLIFANKELAFENKEKDKRATELINAKEHAEESDRLKSAFLTNMSHEIRTPMNGILGFTELLKEPKLTSDEQQDYIQIIQISGARMLNTINNIVDVSKIESALIQVDIKETNINEKMEFTYKFFKPEVEIKGLQFLLKNSLPSKEAIIKTDNEKVYGILTNLVRNAIKFTFEGSIEFGYEKKGEYLEFFIKDTGVGIPENQKKRPQSKMLFLQSIKKLK